MAVVMATGNYNKKNDTTRDNKKWLKFTCDNCSLGSSFPTKVSFSTHKFTISSDSQAKRYSLPSKRRTRKTCLENLLPW